MGRKWLKKAFAQCNEIIVPVTNQSRKQNINPILPTVGLQPLQGVQQRTPSSLYTKFTQRSKFLYGK
jgi:hypothetical protein